MKRTVINTYKVFLNGVEQRKTIKQYQGQMMNPVWTQFNSWAKKQKATQVESNQYLGALGWEIPGKGTAELRRMPKNA